MHHQSNCFLNYRSFSNIDKRLHNETADNYVINLFNKKFQFRFDSEWVLPDPINWFSKLSWKVDKLVSLKCRLNYHKSQLNDFDLEEWSAHTRRRNPAGEVCWRVRCIINPEFLTQAWTKFYECAYSYSILPKHAIYDKKMVSLHLCEAPGAFITSLNHYIKQHHPEIEWKWVASTLNPYYEGNSLSNMITDDRFIFHTLDNWNFGMDNTGNLMDWDNSQAIIAKAKSLGKVLLVTADGSIDCLEKPDAQEQATSMLHYCEIVTALQALSTGGTLLFKLFTIFEHPTVCLLYLLNILFKEVNIFKPVTSRQGNSEVYAVCLNFKGSQELQQYIPIMKSGYGTDCHGNTAMFPLECIPVSFLAQIKDCSEMFCSMQCDVINDNIQAYLLQNNHAIHNSMKQVRGAVASEYIKRYKLCPLHLDDEIMKGVLHEENKMNNNPRFHRGSYTERQLYSNMCLRDKINNLHSTFRDIVVPNPGIFINSNNPDFILWLNVYDENFNLNLTFTYGHPIERVNSSKFIFVPILRLYQQILAEDDLKKHIQTYMIRHRDSENDSYDTDDSIQLLTFPEYDHVENYGKYEKRCFKNLCEKIQKADLGQTIVLKGYNLLTHFAVSVIYILSKRIFEKTGFTNCSIILNNLINKSACDYLNKVDAECERAMSNGSKDVLNSLPVRLTNVGNFFDNIVLFNNTLYRNKCSNYIEEIEKSI